MKTVLFELYNQQKLADTIRGAKQYIEGDMILRNFPDAETYIQIRSVIEDKKIIVLASLDQPNTKLIDLLFTAATARDLGAVEVGLIAPYLAYMRQDTRFHPGEGITAHYFAQIISQHFDWLITVTPHLHRVHALNELYRIPTKVIAAGTAISSWISQQIEKPVIIGPDQESTPWIQQIAMDLQAPYVIAKKDRFGDRQVAVTLPPMDSYRQHIPVIVDDIISSGKTMLETVKLLQTKGCRTPVCIAVHAIFAGNAYQDLLNAGVSQIVTVNTIPHPSNVIDISPWLIAALKE